MRDFETVDTAHMACGACWHKHVPRCERTRIRLEIKEITLCCEHHAVLGFVIDLYLRMVGAHVALTARRGQSCQLNRTGVAGVALSATPDGSIVIRLSDGVTLLAPGRNRRVPFRYCEWIRWTLCTTGLELFAEGDLLR